MTRFKTTEEWFLKEALVELDPVKVPTIHINELEETAPRREEAISELVRLLLKLGRYTERIEFIEALGIIPLARDGFDTTPPGPDQLTQELGDVPPLLGLRHLQSHRLSTGGEVYSCAIEGMQLPAPLRAEYVVFRDREALREDWEYSVNVELTYLPRSFQEVLRRYEH